ncbi:restriction endonuclease subunit S [Shewanella olleyana]|uniref:restriction endonuclease subunit S n=1 Tax=Shewanella olleyana TaxID=135626 RepID=UPI00200E6966|nr:restriction endonuclease subunit S [Shewanella olleyana]MCL1068006.1 restriction endonuclease subunit S [Shewanella olleyana]
MSVPTKKISDLFSDVKIGGTPSRGNPSYFDGSNLWVSIRDMEGQPILTRTAECISDDGVRNSNCKLVKKGSLLFSFKLTVGRTSFAGEELYTNEAIATFDPDEAKASGIDLDYLSLVLPMAASRDDTKNSMGAALLNKNKILNLDVPYLELTQQRKIAASLKAQLTEVETARQAALVQLSDVHLLRARMLKAFFAALDSVPKKRLGDNAPTTSGSTPSRGNKQYWKPAEIAWVKTGEVAFAPITSTEEAISNLALAECSVKLLPPKSVLIAMIGQGKTRGQSAILEIPATTNQNCFAVMPNDTWEPEFLYLWMKSSYQDLRELSSDRGGSQSALNGTLLNALEVPAPTKAEQLELVARIQSAMTEIDALEQSTKAKLVDIEKLPAHILAKSFEN